MSPSRRTPIRSIPKGQISPDFFGPPEQKNERYQERTNAEVARYMNEDKCADCRHGNGRGGNGRGGHRHGNHRKWGSACCMLGGSSSNTDECVVPGTEAEAGPALIILT